MSLQLLKSAIIAVFLLACFVNALNCPPVLSCDQITCANKQCTSTNYRYTEKKTRYYVQIFPNISQLTLHLVLCNCFSPHRTKTFWKTFREPMMMNEGGSLLLCMACHPT